MFDDLNEDTWAHSSVQRAEQEALKKARRGHHTSNRDKNNPDDQAILSYKLRLDKLQRERQYKNAALAARNALLIERDEKARDEHRRTHKTDEELMQEWIDERNKQHAEERQSFENDTEARIRAAIAEEKALEFKCIDYDYNLSTFTFTVEREVAKHRREERKRMEAQARLQSSSEALQRQQKLLMESWQEGTTTIEREERAMRRNVVTRFPDCLREARLACEARVKFEAQEAERMRIEEATRREQELDGEVEDMEKEFERRMKKLGSKFQIDSGR